MSVPAYLYLRLVIYNQASSPPSLSELAFYNSTGTSLASGGTPSSSSNYNATTNPVSNAFDGNTGTWWAASTGGSASNPQWIQYQFLSAVTLDHFTITARNDTSYNQTPTSFDVFGSNDGVTWVDIGKNFSASWSSAAQSQTFTVSGGNPSGRLTQVAREVLSGPANPKAHVTQVAREVLSGPANPKARVTQFAREVLVSLTANTQPFIAIIT